MNSALASAAAIATWDVPILLISVPDEVTVSAPTKTRSTFCITVLTALSMMRVTSSAPAFFRSRTVRIPCLHGRDSVAYTLTSFPWRMASAITPMAALLLQWVIRTSPSLILLAPNLAMASTAFSESSAKRLPLSMTDCRAPARSDAESTSRMVACTPFHSETAVGLDPRRISAALEMSSLNDPRSESWYDSA